MTNSRKRFICDLKTRHAACKILGVSEVEGKEAIQKAYRRASLKYHPDHNPTDKDAHKRFLRVKRAYEFTAKDKPCLILLDEIESWPGVTEDGRYEFDNLWRHFLW